MGDAFSDHGCSYPKCVMCGHEFDPQWGCFHCRKDQSGKPWDTPQSVRKSLNNRIKSLRGILKNEEEKLRKMRVNYKDEIRRLQATKRRVSKTNVLGEIKIEISAEEQDKIADEWEPGRSLWDPKRKEKK